MKTQRTTRAWWERFIREERASSRLVETNPFSHPSAFDCGVDVADFAAPKCSEGGRMGDGRGLRVSDSMFGVRCSMFDVIRVHGEGTSAAKLRATSRGFTLIEIMVVIVLLTLIVLGLIAMFDQTQKAFRTGMTQTDQMEGARMFSDLLQRDIMQITPSHQTNTVNFLADMPFNGGYVPFQQTLPSTSSTRTNILEDLYFVSRVNQTWSGIGYFVRTNPGVGAYVDSVGTLYRFQTNMPIGLFNAFPQSAFLTFLSATNLGYSSLNPTTPQPISKILDGVVEFHVRCYDTNGMLMNQNSSINYPSNSLVIQNWAPNGPPFIPNEIQLYAFSNNIVPAYVEVELGLLEQPVLKRYQAIPDPVARSTFLANHAGNVQVFRQRIPIHNVDPTAY